MAILERFTSRSSNSFKTDIAVRGGNHNYPEEWVPNIHVLSELLAMLEAPENADMLEEFGEWKEEWEYALVLANAIDNGLMKPNKNVKAQDSTYEFIYEQIDACFHSLCLKLDIPYLGEYNSMDDVVAMVDTDEEYESFWFNDDEEEEDE